MLHINIGMDTTLRNDSPYLAPKVEPSFINLAKSYIYCMWSHLRQRRKPNFHTGSPSPKSNICCSR
nr:hypothetical protein Iba_chr08dCG4340 [Ipomoea batatas]